MEGLKKEFPGQVEYLAGDLADFEVCFVSLFFLESICRCFCIYWNKVVGLWLYWLD